MSVASLDYSYNVFLNCPFDTEFKPLFNAMVFTVQACGFTPRCALEDSGTDDIRILKIIGIMDECGLGIHDLSRTESNEVGLPRFNMPLELGIFVGAKHFGSEQNKKKRYLVLDKEAFRYQAYISDLGGQDIQRHNDTVEGMITSVRHWLGHRTKRKLPGGTYILGQYQQFLEVLPEMCAELKQTTEELTFLDYTSLVSNWINIKF
jgi:hypothetical protein